MDLKMLGRLVPCGGGDPIPLQEEKLLVGRRSRCDITLRFPNVSSHHCELELITGFWKIRDVGSRNGIKVNGERCESHWLMPGDVISIAKHRYEIEYVPEGDTPPTAEENPFAISLLEKAGLISSDSEDAEAYRTQTSAASKSTTSANSLEDDIFTEDEVE